MLEIELVIVYYVILILIALDTIILGSCIIHKRRHSSKHPRRPRAKTSSSVSYLIK